jgi:hypothetical protein
MSLKFLKKINGDKNGHFKELIDSFTKKSICPNISWNCNAKNDFRNLFYLSKSYIHKNVLNEDGVNWEEPDLHIYTDNEYFDELFPSKTTAYYIKPKSEFETFLLEMDTLGSWCLYDDERTRIRVKKLEYLPSYSDTLTDNNIAFIVLDITSKKLGNIEMNLIYIKANENWFANELIKEKVEISHVTNVIQHYETIPPTFIVNILTKLKVRYFISDSSYLVNNQDVIKLTTAFPNLIKDIESLSTLSEFFKVENKSWRNLYGDVSFYKVK